MTSFAAPAPAPTSTVLPPWLTAPGSGPRTTFPLVLTALTISVLSMTLDAVPSYSETAFGVGTLLTLVLAIVTGKLVDSAIGVRHRLVSTLLLPTLCGAFIGMVVQALVLADVGTRWGVKDLGGLVATTEPISWIASGIVLGGFPALLVAGFLVLASRAVRRIAGHDGFEGFSVGFTGFAGVLAALGLVLTEGVGAPALCLVVVASALTVLVAIVIDGSRLRFLRDVYAGRDRSFDIVPAERFANDPSLAPLVQSARGGFVLVRLVKSMYRAAAAEPIAIVAETETDTLRPVVRRRLLASSMLTTMLGLVGYAALIHA